MSKGIKTLVRFGIFGAACSAVVVATGMPLLLPVCWLVLAPVVLGDGR